MKKLLFGILTFLSILCYSQSDNRIINSKKDSIDYSMSSQKNVQEIDSINSEEKIDLIKKKLNHLSYSQYKSTQDLERLKKQMKLAGDDLTKAKNSFFIGLTVQSAGSLIYYAIASADPNNSGLGGGIMAISTGVNLGFILNAWHKIGQSGKRLSEIPN